MSLNSIFDIAGMGMTSQSIRLNTVASNLANAQTAARDADEAYRARRPVFAAVQQQFFENGLDSPIGERSRYDELGVGVRVTEIVESDQPLERRHEPGHPLADDDGYVLYSNVNVVEEMADMIAASRAFQVNVEVMGSAKSMAQQLLRLGQ